MEDSSQRWTWWERREVEQLIIVGERRNRRCDDVRNRVRNRLTCVV